MLLEGQAVLTAGQQRALAAQALQAGQVEAARQGFQQALDQEATPEDYLGLILCHLRQERNRQAVDLVDEALRHFPGHPDLRAARMVARWRASLPLRGVEQHWDGRRPLRGQTLWLYGESYPHGFDPVLQRWTWGLGDLVQFARYVPLLAAQGARVLLQCRPALHGLLRGVPGLVGLLSPEEGTPGFDQQAHLWTLPCLLDAWPQEEAGDFAGGRYWREWQAWQLALARRPTPHPYLFPDEGRVASWRQRLARPPGQTLVAVHWSGGYEGVPDHRRIPLTALAALAQVPGVRLLSVQKGTPRQQLSGCGFPIEDLGAVLDVDGGAVDLAAVLSQVHYLISNDSGPAHVAGALGVPTWVLLPRHHAERFPPTGGSTPLYPCWRLFRPDHGQGWTELAQTVAYELAQQVR